MSRRIAIVAFGLILTACQPAGASLQPSPSATSSSVGATNLIWLDADSTPVVHTLIDWSGHRVGGLQVMGSVLPSPNGSRALVDFSQVIDFRGMQLGRLTLPKSEIHDAMWADDSQHLCLIGDPLNVSPVSGTSSLWLAEPGKSPRRVAAAGTGGSLAGVTSCSILNDRAVIVSDYGAHIPPPQGVKALLTAEVQVIALSSGTVLYQHDYLTQPNAVLALSSADGRYLVENGALSSVASIRDLRDGRILATLPPGVTVLGLSWDGARLFETTAVGTQQSVTVVDRLSGEVVWRQVGDGSNFLPRPETSDLLVSTLRTNLPSILTLIPSTGPARTLPTAGSMVWACPCFGAGSGA